MKFSQQAISDAKSYKLDFGYINRTPIKSNSKFGHISTFEVFAGQQFFNTDSKEMPHATLNTQKQLIAVKPSKIENIFISLGLQNPIHFLYLYLNQLTVLKQKDGIIYIGNLAANSDKLIRIN